MEAYQGVPCQVVSGHTSDTLPVTPEVLSAASPARLKALVEMEDIVKAAASPDVDDGEAMVQAALEERATDVKGQIQLLVGVMLMDVDFKPHPSCRGRLYEDKKREHVLAAMEGDRGAFPSQKYIIDTFDVHGCCAIHSWYRPKAGPVGAVTGICEKCAILCNNALGAADDIAEGDPVDPLSCPKKKAVLEDINRSQLAIKTAAPMPEGFQDQTFPQFGESNASDYILDIQMTIRQRMKCDNEYWVKQINALEAAKKWMNERADHMKRLQKRKAVMIKACLKKKTFKKKANESTKRSREGPDGDTSSKKKAPMAPTLAAGADAAAAANAAGTSGDPAPAPAPVPAPAAPIQDPGIYIAAVD